MCNDFRYALRLLLKAPAFTALTLTVMTCGLAISIYMYSLMNTLVFKDLPFPESENIVVIDKMLHGMRFEAGQLPAADLLAISDQNSSLNDLIFYQDFYVNIKVEDSSKRINAVMIEAGGFEFTNTLPLLGRTLKKSDVREAALDNAVISYKLWNEHFTLDKQVIGKRMQINNQTVTVVGVMPKGYSFPYYADIWFAFGREYIERGKFSNVAGLAKLKPDVSMQAANKDIANIMLQLSQKYPQSNYGVSAYVETLQKQALGSQSMPAIYALIGATFFVLLLSCVNVGSLLLSKALERANETAIRRAIGAPRYRLITQMLWESIIICTISGLLALLIAAWALQLTNPIFAQISYSQPLYWWFFAIDKNTIIATVLIVIFTIFGAGFLPCYVATSGKFNDILRQGSRGATNQHIGRLSQILIKVEVGLSALILVVSTMFVINTLQSNRHLKDFDENNLLTFTIDMPYQHYQTVNGRHQFLYSLEKQIEALPGIKNVAMSSSIPGNLAWVSEVAKQGEENSLDQLYANTVFVSHDLFSVFKIKPIEGRLFDRLDTPQAKKVAVISDSLAQQMWPNESAVGKRITLMAMRRTQVEVVGIIQHIDHGTSAFASAKKGGIYLVDTQLSSTFNTVMVHFEGDQAKLIERISKVLYQLDANVPAFNIMPYQRMIDKNLTGVMFGSQLFAILAFIALILAASGIYGVTANSINQRCREIGIRRALGATKAQVLAYFIKKVIGQLLIGLTLGLLLAMFVCYYLLSTFLISHTLMITVFCSVFAVLIVVMNVAVIVPLLKILKKRPAYALRAE